MRRSKASQEEIFSQAIQGGMLTSSKTPVSNLVSLLISRIDIEREEMAMNLSSEKGIELHKAHEELSSDIEKFMNVYAVQSYALDLLSQRGSGENRQDEELKLERLSSDWLERGGENTSPLAGSIWENASKLQPFNGRVAIESSQFYSKHGDIKKARNVLKQAVGKFNMKFKDEILKEWERFELVFGSVNDILYCRERCKKETEKLWEAWVSNSRKIFLPLYSVSTDLFRPCFLDSVQFSTTSLCYSSSNRSNLDGLCSTCGGRGDGRRLFFVSR